MNGAGPISRHTPIRDSTLRLSKFDIFMHSLIMDSISFSEKHPVLAQNNIEIHNVICSIPFNVLTATARGMHSSVFNTPL